MEHQEVRVEVDAAPGHQFERGVVQEGAVLDGGTAGHDGGAGPIGGVRVDHGPQPLGRGFAAGSGNLLRRHGHLAAVAYAGGGKQLHDVGTAGFHLAHELADLGGVARVLIELPQGGKQAGSGDGAGGDLGAQIGVELRAQTLHRGETAHQRGVEIGCGGESRLLGRRFSAAAALLQASVRIEIPGGVDVGIDPTGHHRHAGQIDGCVAPGIADCGNPSAFDDEIGILQDMSLTVEQGRCADHYSLPIGECGAKYQNPQALHRVPAYRRCTLKYGQETRQASQAPGCPRPRARQGFGARRKNPRTDRSRPRSQPPGPEP